MEFAGMVFGAPGPTFREVLIEALVLLLLVLAAYPLSRARPGWLQRYEALLDRLASRRHLAVFLAAAFPVCLRMALLPLLGVPVPSVHDEFSHLLVADTLAAGRLANPPHPMWIFFESPHILMLPSYASAFPAGLGLMMAAAQFLTSVPWLGVVLAVGFMGGALCWMLQAWIPPRWAFLASLLAGFRLGIFSYWMNSYWGGPLAAAGGALVLGSLPRINRRCRTAHALLMGAGLAILANTRPFEGFVLSLPVAFMLLAWLVRRTGPARGAKAVRVALPLLLLLAVTAAAMSYYCRRVTGDSLRLPYVHYLKTYAMAPVYVWQSPRPAPAYRHEMLRQFYTDVATENYRQLQTIGLFRHTRGLAKIYWRFFLGPLLLLPFLMIPMIIASRKVRTLAIMGAWFFLAALATQIFVVPHYAAPAAGIIYGLVGAGMRALSLKSPAGAWMARALLPACILAMILNLSVGSRYPVILEATGEPKSTLRNREEIRSDLLLRPGKHLIFVRYQPGHSSSLEWVYNRADIDASRVVWARMMQPSANETLVAYFKDRQVWIVDADAENPSLSPYLSGRSGSRPVETNPDVTGAK